jgi:GAF domain-containing protein
VVICFTSLKHSTTVFLLSVAVVLEGACKYVIETQKSLYIPQLSKEKAQLPFQIINISGTEEKESHIFVPLTLRGVSLGVLSIQHSLPEAYGQEDLFVLQLLANYIALAIHNMLLYSSLSQLNETGQLLTRLLESEQTLQATVDKICDATLADLVVLYPYEASRHCFVLPPSTAGTLLDSTSIQSMSSTRPDDIVERMLHHEKPIFAKNTTVDTGQDGTTHIRQGSFGKRENIRSTAALPLRVGDELVGVLFVNFRQPQRFDATQKLFIEGLAHYAAIAIKNAQVFGTLIQRRVHELEILQKIDRELSRTLDLETVLNTLLRLAHEQMPVEEVAIWLYNPQTQILAAKAAIGPNAEARLTYTLPTHTSQGITWWVMEHKMPARVDNVHRDPQWRDIYIQTDPNTISELDVPLLDGDEVIGVLNFESTREGAFRQEDEYFLLTLAGQAVLAIKNAQAYEREKRLAKESQVLNEISKEITSQLDLTPVFDLILEKALELTHSHMGNLMLYDADQNDLWMAAERGMAGDKKGQRQGLDQGVVGYVARNKQLLNVDLSQPPWNEIYLELFPGARSELAAPMLAGNELRGVLNVEGSSPNNFNESDERLLQGLADLAVVALQNAQAYERERRFAAEGQVLNEISKEITSQLDLAHVFDLILKKALELTRSTTGNLMLYDPDKHDMWMAAERGVSQDKKNRRQSLHEGIVGNVARTKQLLNVDLSQPPWRDINLDFIPGTRSELAVPMLAGDELHGVLNIESLSSNNFSEGDERLLQGLADLAVIALQNARAYEREKRLAQESQVLNEISKEITSQLDYVRVFNLILESVSNSKSRMW